jgi:hypothetical protein
MKREHRRRPAVLTRRMDGRVNDGLVSKVNAIEHPNRQMQRTASGPHILKRSGAGFCTHDFAGNR